MSEVSAEHDLLVESAYTDNVAITKVAASECVASR